MKAPEKKLDVTDLPISDYYNYAIRVLFPTVQCGYFIDSKYYCHIFFIVSFYISTTCVHIQTCFLLD